MLKQVVSDQVRQTFSLPKFVNTVVKTSLRSGLGKFIDYVEIHNELLHCYNPIGTYYIYNSTDNTEKPLLTSDYNVIFELLSFHPPIKLIHKTNGEAIRIQLKQMDWRCDECLVPPPSNSAVTSMRRRSSLHSAKVDQMNDKERGKHLKMEEMRIKMLQRLYEVEEDQDWCDRYICVLDEDVDICGYTKLKLSPKGWIDLLNNHMIDQYLQLFEAQNGILTSALDLYPPHLRSKLLALRRSSTSDTTTFHFSSPLPTSHSPVRQRFLLTNKLFTVSILFLFFDKLFIATLQNIKNSHFFSQSFTLFTTQGHITKSITAILFLPFFFLSFFYFIHTTTFQTGVQI
ncbi:hypothetical protein RFI_02047 [Reticulomyxa filosa]|uniref:Uncharacterized protein n=1 Tax=Reticulomyxa filosa TaxID=46433 RepID=X6PA16_RETFI|nr:hypothetical protein RFI_02047 [Reticulomyxa filosa]|eukprot:ETO35026.1 hypothetical protein RFI_02047 [Reticulomyxa filosa]